MKGTVMEHSKLSMRNWFYTMHLMTSIKQVLSAKEVQHQLGVDEYPPVWLMMMKLRNIMGKREAIYQLSREVEIDEAFFPIRTPEEAKGEPVKRGAGSQQQAKVGSSDKVRGKANQISTIRGRKRMKCPLHHAVDF